MWPWKKEKSNREGPQRELSLDEAVSKALGQYEPSQPVLRPLKQPLYDTLTAVAGVPDNLDFFTEPVKEGEKGYAETNMVLSGQVPKPTMFDLWGFHVEPLGHLFWSDFQTLYFGSYVEFGFKDSRAPQPWLRVPLSFLPLRSVVADEAQLKAYASALVNPTDERWRSLIVSDPTPDRKEATSKLFMTEAYRDITVKKRPIRIRPKEDFYVKVLIDKNQWRRKGWELTRPVSFRMFMLGIFYAEL